MSKADHVHCFLHGKIDVNAAHFVQPAIPKGKAHSVEHQPIKEFCLYCHFLVETSVKQDLRNAVKAELVSFATVKVIQLHRHCAASY